MLKMYVNNSTQDEPLGESGVEWTEVNFDNDYIVFSAGSDTVKHGEELPSQNQLNQAGVVISETEKVIVPKYFLADFSDNELKEIKLAGDQNKRYVFAFDFEGATAAEPVLEAWDTSDMDTIDFDVLGAGVAADSWVNAITTTHSVPGANWLGVNPTAGQRLAGSSDGFFLELNGGQGALSEAKTLYCQLKIIVPQNAPRAGFEDPVFVVKYVSN